MIYFESIHCFLLHQCKFNWEKCILVIVLKGQKIKVWNVTLRMSNITSFLALICCENQKYCMELAKIVFSISLNRILRDKIKTNVFSLTVLEKWAFEIQSYVWNKIARTSPVRNARLSEIFLWLDFITDASHLLIKFVGFKSL